MKKVIIVLILAFVFVSCGGDKEFSELVIGSWKNVGNSYSSIIHVNSYLQVYPYVNLTFSSGGRFDLVVKVGEVDSVGKFGFIIVGNYDVYGSTISFHCDRSTSTVIVYVPGFRDTSSTLEELENTFSGTLDVHFHKDKMDLADTRWERSN